MPIVGWPAIAQLGSRCEDPDTEVGAGRLRWQDERRFRKRHLAGDPQHQVIRDPARVRQHCQLVSTKQLVSKNVQLEKPERLHGAMVAVFTKSSLGNSFSRYLLPCICSEP